MRDLDRQSKDAACSIHWYEPSGHRWLQLDSRSGVWSGWAAEDGSPVVADDLDGSWRPWKSILDESRAPFYRWFVGAETNAGFNEVDRNVLGGRGRHPALIFEPDYRDVSHADASENNAHRNGKTTYGTLLFETVRAAEVLKGLGLRRGDRLAFNLPNIPAQVFYTEAAKRLGIIYTPVFGGFSAKTLAERIVDVGASAVVTADGGYRSGKVVPYKENYTDRALAEAGHSVRRVVVVRHTGQEINFGERDVWSHELLEKASDVVIDNARRAGYAVFSEDDLLALPDRDLWRALAATNVAEPVESDWPLFVIYTSGSTGKPKGVVHVHGGWLSGLVQTMKTVFDVRPEDRIYTVADPGWITGQSYLIAAPLATGITSILGEGSPLFPTATRFASIIKRHGATIFKAGSTFLKSVMTDPRMIEDLARHNLSTLKVATFCAEPVSTTVQKFAIDHICPRYINSYWATEHGGMILSRAWEEGPDVAPDARTRALPGICAEVRVAETRDDPEAYGPQKWRLAKRGEKGELVLTEPYPYLARTVWGDPERLGTPDWVGDLKRFTQTYFSRWSGDLAYTQGDYAQRYDDGSFTLHGRSDDVINVAGHRIGTGELEDAILRDKLRADSPIGNAVVVGAPHDVKGQTPVAFLIPAPGCEITDTDLRRLDDLVRAEKGGVGCVPSHYFFVSQFPETRSGKYVRRMMRNHLVGEPTGDASTLRNPEALDEIRQVIEEWLHGRAD